MMVFARGFPPCLVWILVTMDGDCGLRLRGARVYQLVRDADKKNE